MTERAFWVEYRRWLKIQNEANAQMIAAIEQRFGPFGQERQAERRSEKRSA